MDPFCVNSGEKVLFVGEGNFSFCVDFIKFNSSSESEEQNFEITASCFESNSNLSEIKERNVNFLERRGVTVLFDVDARYLKDHSVIGCKTFNKVIFNFPHVGGKMKINLNRKLLGDFFLNSRYVLDGNGVILLTLCDGQGGTGADKTKRRWDDTWKVVEIAAEFDFALKQVYPFKHDNFPGYINVGYRSSDKGFNANHALTHVFKTCDGPRILNFNDHEIESLFHVEKTLFGMEVSKVYSHKILCDPFNNKHTPQSFFYEHLRKMTFHEEVKFFDNISFLCGVQCCYESSFDAIKGCVKRNELDYNNTIQVFKGISLNKLTDDFSHQPVSCEIVCLGNESYAFFIKAITELLKFRNGLIDNIIQDESDNQEILCVQDSIQFCAGRRDSVFLDDKLIQVCTIYLDNLAKYILNLDSWHELWADGCKIIFNEDKINLLTPCIFPSIYIFDISFSVEDCSYLKDEFIKILWHIAGNFIFNVNLVSIYYPPNKVGYKNFCYRISYRSYEVPLFRKRVVELQRIIGRTLEKLLNVNVL